MHWKNFGLASALWIAGSLPAHAYIDPGTGSILVQAVIGVVLAAGIFARSWWSRVLTFLGLNRIGKGARPAARE